MKRHKPVGQHLTVRYGAVFSVRLHLDDRASLRVARPILLKMHARQVKLAVQPLRSLGEGQSRLLCPSIHEELNPRFLGDYGMIGGLPRGHLFRIVGPGRPEDIEDVTAELAHLASMNHVAGKKQDVVFLHRRDAVQDNLFDRAPQHGHQLLLGMDMVGKGRVRIHPQKAHLRSPAGDEPRVRTRTELCELQVLEGINNVRLYGRLQRKAPGVWARRQVFDPSLGDIIGPGRPINLQDLRSLSPCPDRVLGALFKVDEIIPLGPAVRSIRHFCGHGLHGEVTAADELINPSLHHHHDPLSRQHLVGDLCARLELDPGDQVPFSPVELSDGAWCDLDCWKLAQIRYDAGLEVGGKLDLWNIRPHPAGQVFLPDEFLVLNHPIRLPLAGVYSQNRNGDETSGDTPKYVSSACCPSHFSSSST